MTFMNDSHRGGRGSFIEAPIAIGLAVAMLVIKPSLSSVRSLETNCTRWQRRPKRLWRQPATNLIKGRHHHHQR